MPTSKEPERLRQGKEFHRRVQADWQRQSPDVVTVEANVVKLNGRRGRVDVFVRDTGQSVAVAEIKNSDWDAMSEVALRRNVRRQILQVWQYIDCQVEAGNSVSPGIAFPRRPRDAMRLALIEKLFDEACIAVVWEDETIAERRARAEGAG